MMLPYELVDYILLSIPKGLRVLLNTKYYVKSGGKSDDLEGIKMWLLTRDNPDVRFDKRLLHCYESGIVIELSLVRPNLAHTYQKVETQLIPYYTSQADHVSVISLDPGCYYTKIYMVIYYFKGCPREPFIYKLNNKLGINTNKIDIGLLSITHN